MCGKITVFSSEFAEVSQWLRDKPTGRLTLASTNFIWSKENTWKTEKTTETFGEVETAVATRDVGVTEVVSAVGSLCKWIFVIRANFLCALYAMKLLFTSQLSLLPQTKRCSYVLLVDRLCSFRGQHCRCIWSICRAVQMKQKWMQFELTASIFLV
jgi:hypothetical protein